MVRAPARDTVWERAMAQNGGKKDFGILLRRYWSGRPLPPTGSPRMHRNNFTLSLGFQIPHGRCKPAADLLGSAADRIRVEVSVSSGG